MPEATHERPAVNPHNIANLAYALTGKSANSGTHETEYQHSRSTQSEKQSEDY